MGYGDFYWGFYRDYYRDPLGLGFRGFQSREFRVEGASGSVSFLCLQSFGSSRDKASGGFRVTGVPGCIKP